MGIMNRKQRQDALARFHTERHTPIVTMLLGLHTAILALPGFLLLTIPGPTMDLLQWEVCNMTVIRLNAVLLLAMAFLTLRTLQTTPMQCELSFSILIFFDVGVALAVLLSLVEDESARTWSFTVALVLSIVFALIWVYYKGHYERMALVRQINASQQHEDDMEADAY